MMTVGKICKGDLPKNYVITLKATLATSLVAIEVMIYKLMSTGAPLVDVVDQPEVCSVFVDYLLERCRSS